MDLFENPFHILGATPLDDIHKIGELAEERSLLSDVDECMNAKSILTNPRKRVAAEVAWLPGVNPNRANDMLMLLESSAGNYLCSNGLSANSQNDSLAAALSRLPCTDTYNVADEVLDLFKLSNKESKLDNKLQHERQLYRIDNLMQIRQYLGIEKMNSIARSNILAARISRLPNHMSDYVANWILAIARAFDRINPEELCAIINAERRKAGVSKITDISVVATEIQRRRHYYQQIIKSVLTKIYPAKERLNTIMKLVDDSSLTYKKNRRPILIDDTIDVYAVKTTPILKIEEEDIKKYDRELRFAADIKDSKSTLTDLMEKLIKSVKNWHNMAQPILLQKKRLGYKDTESYRVAMDVRQLAIYLFNVHGELHISQQILMKLNEIFAENPTIVENISSDLDALNRNAERRKQKN